MSHRPFIRYALLISVLILLLVLAWGATAGGIRQFPRSNTIGQQVETIIQIACGLLCLLTILTCFWGRRWVKPIRTAWVISFATAAGLSSQVWGPPMPLIGIFFAIVALLVSLAIVWLLQRCSRGNYHRHLDRTTGVSKDACVPGMAQN